jgi:hypothetical protein
MAQSGRPADLFVIPGGGGLWGGQNGEPPCLLTGQNKDPYACSGAQNRTLHACLGCAQSCSLSAHDKTAAGQVGGRNWNWREKESCVRLMEVSVNYAFRFSGPVTVLTARRVRYGVGPDLICQPGPSPGIKTHSAPRRFSNNSLASFCSLPLSHLPAPPPSCLRPRRAPLTPLPGR